MRRHTMRWVGGAVVVIVIAGVLVAWGLSRGQPTRVASQTAVPGPSDTATATASGPPGPEGIPTEEGQLLAPASAAAAGQPEDGISCDTHEQVAYHIHTHLAVYVAGALRPVPGGIGVVQPVAQQTPDGPFFQASHCYYWLHTHAQDGIIHVEAPDQKTYTLGQFFAVWQEPLSRDRVGPAQGPVHAWVNGTPYSGDPATIPLRSHEDVQLDVGSPTVPPRRIDWSAAQL